MLEPHYQIFKDRLKKVKFKDMKILFPTMENLQKKLILIQKKMDYCVQSYQIKIVKQLEVALIDINILKTNMNQHYVMQETMARKQNFFNC